MNGVVTGGWNYVWAAYGLTFSAFAIYGFTLVRNLLREQRNGAPK